MTLLLDTHVLIWVFDNSPILSEEASEAIADGQLRIEVLLHS